MLKICNRCLRMLPLKNYTPDRNNLDGLYPTCKECKNKGVLTRIDPPPFRVCNKCGIEKPIIKFSPTKKRRDNRDTICNACKSPSKRKWSKTYINAKARTAERNIRVRAEIKTMLIERLGGKCHRCGIAPGDEWPVACFDFHHKDRDAKTMLFARKLANNTQIDQLIKEADGCMVLCATCHRREHAIEHAERIARRARVT